LRRSRYTSGFTLQFRTIEEKPPLVLTPRIQVQHGCNMHVPARLLLAVAIAQEQRLILIYLHTFPKSERRHPVNERQQTKSPKRNQKERPKNRQRENCQFFQSYCTTAYTIVLIYPTPHEITSISLYPAHHTTPLHPHHRFPSSRRMPHVSPPLLVRSAGMKRIDAGL
jgi:hypothetical protein